jgi:hypothetical protein
MRESKLCSIGEEWAFFEDFGRGGVEQKWLEYDPKKPFAVGNFKIQPFSKEIILSSKANKCLLALMGSNNLQKWPER